MFLNKLIISYYELIQGKIKTNYKSIHIDCHPVKFSIGEELRNGDKVYEIKHIRSAGFSSGSFVAVAIDLVLKNKKS